MEDKFIYQNENEIQLLSSQCEVCIYYNDGGYSSECPTEKLKEIQSNICECSKKTIKSLLD